MKAIAIGKITVADYRRNSIRSYVKDDRTELIISMKKEGLINPIVVEPSNKGKFKLIHGYRRLLAAKALGWKTINCIMKGEYYS